MGRPLCVRCKKNLALRYQGYGTRYKKEYQSLCSGCRDTSAITRNKNAYYSNKDRTANCNVRKAYGITLEEYRNLKELQDHRCYICGATAGAGRGTELCLDHNHTTGAIRKFLCRKCNMALSIVEDVDYCQKLVDYLEEHK